MALEHSFWGGRSFGMVEPVEMPLESGASIMASSLIDGKSGRLVERDHGSWRMGIDGIHQPLKMACPNPLSAT